MTTKKKKRHYEVYFKDDGSKAGHVRLTGGGIEDRLLWKGGSNWYPAIFETKEQAKSTIKMTNNSRRDKGYRLFQFIIKEVMVKE